MVTKKSSGFTIVEILIVIIVIAILATVSVVAYNGVQQRTRNAQTAHAVRVYKDALTLYRSENGFYPTSASRACLGNSYPGGTCWFGSGTSNAALMTTLTSVVGGQLPMPALPNVSLKGIMYTPASFGQRLDGIVADFITYSIEGTGACPVGPVATPSGINFLSAQPASGQSYAATASNPVQCWVPLPIAE